MRNSAAVASILTTPFFNLSLVSFGSATLNSRALIYQQVCISSMIWDSCSTPPWRFWPILIRSDLVFIDTCTMKM